MIELNNFNSFFESSTKALGNYNKHAYPIKNKLISSKNCDESTKKVRNKFFYEVPGTPRLVIYQDDFFLPALQSHFVLAWLASIKIMPQPGRLIVYLGSYQGGDLPVKALESHEHKTQDRNAREIEGFIPFKYSGITSAISKGSVVFIHGHLVHASNTIYNFYALFNTCIKEDVSVRPRFYRRGEKGVLS